MSTPGIFDPAIPDRMQHDFSADIYEKAMRAAQLCVQLERLIRDPRGNITMLFEDFREAFESVVIVSQFDSEVAKNDTLIVSIEAWIQKPISSVESGATAYIFEGTRMFRQYIQALVASNILQLKKSG
ncbi:MAG: hypothetical protein WC683_11710 [bacterium]